MNLLLKNTRKYIGVALIGMASLASCKKTLEVLPYTSFSDATAFTSPARVEAAMNGVYDAAQSGFYAGGAVRGYPFGAAAIEQGDMRGEDMLNDALFYQIIEYVAVPAAPVAFTGIRSSWVRCDVARITGFSPVGNSTKYCLSLMA